MDNFDYTEEQLDVLIAEYRQLMPDHDLIVFHALTKTVTGDQNFTDKQKETIFIDRADFSVIEDFIAQSHEFKKQNLTMVLSTLGGYYSIAKELLLLLKNNYTHIDGCVSELCMSCGAYLAFNFQGLYLDHQTGALGAFDPLFLDIHGNYRPLYSALVTDKLDHPQLTAAEDAALPQHVKDLHREYYDVDASLRTTLPQGMLKERPHDVQKIIDRFYKDTHPDYHAHHKPMWFAEVQQHLPEVKELDSHRAHLVLKRIHTICEYLLHSNNHARVYIFNDEIAYRESNA